MQTNDSAWGGGQARIPVDLSKTKLCCWASQSVSRTIPWPSPPDVGQVKGSVLHFKRSPQVILSRTNMRTAALGHVRSWA